MPSHQHLSFFELVDLSVTDPLALAELEARYRADVAVLVVHFTGTAIFRACPSIIEMLALNRSAAHGLHPIIAAHHGHFIKHVEDTVFACFDEPRAALFAAFDIQARMAGFNRTRSDYQLLPSIGLGFGSCYTVPQQDVLGKEAHHARVLSSDVATADQLLATMGFRSALGSIPEGVGMHEASNDLTKQVGFHFVEIRDYRD